MTCSTHYPPMVNKADNSKTYLDRIAKTIPQLTDLFYAKCPIGVRILMPPTKMHHGWAEYRLTGSEVKLLIDVSDHGQFKLEHYSWGPEGAECSHILVFSYAIDGRTLRMYIGTPNSSSYAHLL